jgi:hypothetical protein
MKQILFMIFFSLSFSSQGAFSVGVAEMYEIDFVRVDRSGFGYVKFKTNLIGTPASCTQVGYEAVLAFDTNEAGGKAVLSVVLSAQASGKKVLARGTGSCGVYGVMEQWDWGYIK